MNLETTIQNLKHYGQLDEEKLDRGAAQICMESLAHHWHIRFFQTIGPKLHFPPGPPADNLSSNTISYASHFTRFQTFPLTED